MNTLLQNTVKRETALRTRYKVVTMWECRLLQMLEEDDKMREFFEDCDVSEDLCLLPREGLAGGRTEAWRYIQAPGPNDVIRYLDIVSLYPSVMFFNKFPVGEPTVHIRFTPEQLKTLPFRGLIKCKVSPPRGLKLPVLPFRHAGRLLFPLCSTCAKICDERATCKHTEEERALKGTWTDIELKAALARGYTVTRIDEVWDWPEEQWEDGIYTEYIRTFFRLKLISSGWPPQITNAKQRHEYLERYRQLMGLELSEDDITFNPAMRFISKLILNSLWGKFAQKADMTTREFVSIAEQVAISLNPSRVMKGFQTYDRNEQLVVHAPVSSVVHSSRYAALHHACFVTSYGRLKLYELMELVGDRLIYNDTDSLIFLCRNGEPNPLESKLTGFLGDLSDEVPKGYFIKEVTCNGPKSYSYTLRRKRAHGEISGEKDEKDKEVVKCKGIYQTELTTELSHEGLTNIVTSHLNPSEFEPFTITVPQFNIIRPEIGTIVSVDSTKIIRHVNTKTAVVGTDPLTAFRIPFGF